MAGYSGTPLPKKLGIKEEQRVWFPGAPDQFADALGELPAGVEVKSRAAKGLDVVVFFTKRRIELEQRLLSLSKALDPAGGLWIAWPKKTSGVPTDMTEDVVRDVALPEGLVDNKVCAIDETWSGLRLVWRLENRSVV
jgi:hypothetical protein